MLSPEAPEKQGLQATPLSLSTMQTGIGFDGMKRNNTTQCCLLLIPKLVQKNIMIAAERSNRAKMDVLYHPHLTSTRVFNQCCFSPILRSEI